MKEDFEKENTKWHFAAGKWERRKSGESTVLAQTAETQPRAVAILEDKRFSDVDVSVKFRPISGNEDASGGILFRAKDAKNYFLVSSTVPLFYSRNPRKSSITPLESRERGFYGVDDSAHPTGTVRNHQGRPV